MTSAPTTRESLGTRGWLVLITLCGATFMTGLDYSIITVALPEIGRELAFATRGDLQWVVTACLLPTAALMPLFGRMSDVVGRRRLFALGVTAFTAFSLLAALAPVPAVLVGARAGQGVAAAMIGPTALALMTTVFPEGPRRTRALGVNGALLSLGFVAGTIGGGVVTSGLSWRWTMLILAFIGVVVLVGLFTVVPAAGHRAAARLDVPGAVLAAAGLFALVYGVSTLSWASAVAAGLLLGAFLAVEARHRAPLVPPRLLRLPTVRWGMVTALVTFAMCGGATVLLSVYMQEVLGWSALETGLGFLGEGVAALVAGGLAARLIDARGTRATIAVGLTVQAAGTAAMALLPAAGGLGVLLATSAAMGFGHVLTVVAAVTTITSGLDPADQGVAGGLAQLPTFVGAIGVAGLTAIVSAHADLLSGLRTAFVVAGAVVLLGVVLPLRLRQPVQQPG
ncbi:MFS transporter [Nonomuraea jiangxiensis]|uniref:Predicted arabinose efflux permease, MFS family n=1 Tax=Nonomuraea jiangxiensis TaxID=633440 RepID=A0A1G8LQD0_9ACTN|nr:MFS transporter [Nonomuraea jiangxiensis]SDI57912.1 Predicted arabinose efflux permease, MFS family [Nonomuraea jiangxiensis]